MKSLNLTYRCKDPSNGMPMTLEGLNESAFDAAVLCSAVQDKMKQQSRAESGSKSPRTSEITSRTKGRRSNDINETGREGDVEMMVPFQNMLLYQNLISANFNACRRYHRVRLSRFTEL